MRTTTRFHLMLLRFLVAAWVLTLLGGCGGGGGNQMTSNVYKGQFIDAPVAGLNYSTSTRSGVTDEQGFFTYDQPGETITFFAGTINLGSAQASDAVHVNELSATLDELQSGKHAKTAQLLQSLDTHGGQSSVIKLPGNLTAISTAAGWADKFKVTDPQATVDNVIKGFLQDAQAGQFVTADAAQQKADGHIKDQPCVLPKPSAPNSSITVGTLACQEIAKINYYKARIRPHLYARVAAATDQTDVAAETFSEDAAKKAIDTNPILASLQSIDAAVANIDSALKGDLMEKTAVFSKALAKAVTVYVNKVALAQVGKTAAADLAEENRKRYELTSKLLDTMTATAECSGATNRETSISKCFAVVSKVIDSFDAGGYLQISNDTAQFELMMKTVGDAFDLIAKAHSGDFTNKRISKVGMQRAAAGLAGSLLKVGRDAAELALISNGAQPSKSGVGALVLGLVDQAAAPVLTMMEACGFKTDWRSGASAVWNCASSRAQEISKVLINASVAGIGTAETLRSVGDMNEALVAQDVLEEILYAGNSGYKNLLRKYGISTELKPDAEMNALVRAVGAKKFQPITSYADVFSIVWAATFEGKNSFRVANAQALVTLYRAQLEAAPVVDFSSPGLDMIARPLAGGQVTLDLSVRPRETGVTLGKVTCAAPGANLYGWDVPWHSQFSGFQNFSLSFKYATNGTRAVTCMLYKTDGLLIGSETTLVKVENAQSADNIEINPIAFQQISSSGVSYSTGLVFWIPRSSSGAYDNATVQGLGTETQTNGAAHLQDTGSGTSLSVKQPNGLYSGDVFGLPNALAANAIPAGTSYTVKLYKGTRLVSSQTIRLAGAVLAPSAMTAAMFPALLFDTYAQLCPNGVATTATWYTIPSSLPNSPQNSLHCTNSTASGRVEAGDSNKRRFGTQFAFAVAAPYTPGQSVIDLGAYGKLIAPYFFNGKWYYVWDTDGNELHSWEDAWSHTTYYFNGFGGLLRHDSNYQASSPNGVVDDTYRYGVIHNVKVGLPKITDLQQLNTFLNGGMPSGWLWGVWVSGINYSHTAYWSATGGDGAHMGLVKGFHDTSVMWMQDSCCRNWSSPLVAFEVLSP